MIRLRVIRDDRRHSWRVSDRHLWSVLGAAVLGFLAGWCAR